MKQKILVATTNPGKLAEIRSMLDLDVQWVSLSDFEDIGEVVEDRETFAQNAAKKACEYAKMTGCWTLADDSGLVIDALDGAPGIMSARFSGEPEPGQERGLIDHKNIAKVLRLLEGVPAERRTARFVCCLCLASPKKILLETKGLLDGKITEEQIGQGGFGYDPIFYVDQLKRTIAQVSRQEKNAISHRGNAIRKFKPMLAELLGKL
jgi:XTP/dITP diphosphohydrolase